MHDISLIGQWNSIGCTPIHPPTVSRQPQWVVAIDWGAGRSDWDGLDSALVIVGQAYRWSGNNHTQLTWSTQSHSTCFDCTQFSCCLTELPGCRKWQDLDMPAVAPHPVNELSSRWTSLIKFGMCWLQGWFWWYDPAFVLLGFHAAINHKVLKWFIVMPHYIRHMYLMNESAQSMHWWQIYSAVNEDYRGDAGSK